MDKMKDEIPAVSEEPTNTMQTKSNDEEEAPSETHTKIGGNSQLLLKVLGALAFLVVVVVVPVVLVTTGSNSNSEKSSIGSLEALKDELQATLLDLLLLVLSMT